MRKEIIVAPLNMRVLHIIVQFGVYFIVPLLFLGVAVPENHILGAARSDVWNALWSLSWFSEQIWTGGGLDAPLNHPNGGKLWPSDPLNSILMMPLLGFLSLGTAYKVLCVCLNVLLGWATHQWVRDLQPEATHWGAFAAGLSIQTSSIVLSAIHNGSSEAMSACWVVLALWRFWCLSRQGKGLITTSLLCAMAFFSSWYLGLVTGIFAMAIVSEAPREKYKILFLSLGFAILSVLPFAWLGLELASGAGNLVRIKDPIALEQVRRTIGGVDPLAYFWPGYRAPDFRFISRFGEQFVHSPYIGWGLLLAVFSVYRQTPRWIWLSGLLCFSLSLGPVLIHRAEPLIFFDAWAIPLPYWALEKLPGFQHLSLLFRLAFGLQLALILAMTTKRRSHRQWALISCLILFENVAHAYSLGMPGSSPLPPIEAAQKLSLAPEGGVALYPHVAARPHLYWQRIHHKPIAASLNFPVNGSARRIWLTAAELEKEPDTVFVHTIRQIAQKKQIRYIYMMKDPTAMPDIYHRSALRMRETFGIYASDALSDVVRLW